MRRSQQARPQTPSHEESPPQAARKHATFVAFIITPVTKKNSRACDKVQGDDIVSVFLYGIKNMVIGRPIEKPGVIDECWEPGRPNHSYFWGEI